MKTGIMTCLLFVLSATAVTAEKQPLLHEEYALFFQANRDYKDGAYEKAAVAYEQLIRKGAVSGGILYNLGN